jgi:hypothetical protein
MTLQSNCTYIRCKHRPVTPPTTAMKKEEKEEEEELIRSYIEESDEELINNSDKEMELVEEQMLCVDCGEDPCI